MTHPCDRCREAAFKTEKYALGWLCVDCWRWLKGLTPEARALDVEHWKGDS